MLKTILIRQVRRHPISLFFLLPLAFLLLLGNEWLRLQQTAEDSVAGPPRMELTAHPSSWIRSLPNDGFSIGYSEWRQSAVWAQWLLVGLEHPGGQRPKNFRQDSRLWLSNHSDAYLNSGFDRGHLAPNYAMSKAHGRQAQLDSFLLSNISPQQPNLNRKLWQRIEELETDVWLPKSKRLSVTTGPLFEGEKIRLPNGPEIPTAFYRVVWADTSQGAEVMALVVPQDVTGFEPLQQFLVTIDEIEARSQLDFFSALPDEQEAQLESSIAGAFWELESVGRRPPRYLN